MTKVLKRPLSILLSLVLVLGLIPGMSLTAYAASHSITINNAQHGTVTATVNGSAASSAEEGATVTLTANPDEGYRLKSISGTYKNYYSESFGTGGGTKTHFKVTSTCQTNYRGWRLYNNGTVTVTSTGTQKITKVVFTGCVRGNSAGAAQLGVSSGNLSISGNTIVIDNLSNVTSFTLTGKGNNAATQWQSSGVTVYGNSVVDTQLPITKTSDSNVCTFTMPAVATGNVLITAEFEELPKYTVTWKNGDTTLKTDTVDKDAIPVYNGDTPTWPEDENYTYTFAGWKNGETTYAPNELPAVTGDVTYTATFDATAKPKDLFPQHSITLGGNIGVNFYIDSAAADFANASTAVVKFTWDNGNYHEEVDLKALTPDTSTGYYKATVDVVAAHMAHKIHAEVYLNGEKLEQTDDYSVQDYAETVFANPEKYDNKNKPKQLAALAQALLNYGANAQTVFDSALTEKPALANKTVGNNGYADVTAEQIGAAIKDEASDLNEVATQLGAKYYTNSLIYLSKNTLRIYFTPTTYPGEIPNAGEYDGNLSGYYYYVDHANIPAAELDNQQTFTVGGTTFTFSALDYAKAVVESTKMEPEQQNLAKALYLYNQKANAYFDVAHDHTPGEPVHVSGTPATCSAAGSYYEVTYCTKCGEEVSRVAKTIDKLAHTIVAVAEVPATTEADGVAAHYECSVCHKLFSDAEGNNETTAEALVIPQIVENVVDLSTLTKGYEAQDGDVLINALDGQKYIRIADGATVKLRNANITCLRNSSGINIAGLTLLGDATIILEGTNTIRGGYEYCPGIHVPEGKTLTIDGTGSLDVSSNGRGFACGIGSNNGTNCGNIVINGGNITAYAGTAAGIGAKSGSSCGNITINGGTVNATSGDYGAGIGSTLYGNSICGDITINGGIVNATAKYQGAGIGSGVSANCGNITITGGIVTAIGGVNGAGIGSGEKVSICGNILITGGTVTAKGGENAAGIGSGYTNSSCGTITITDTVTQVTATKGSNAPNSIGAGSNGSTCGDVTIADGANVTQN